MGRYKILPDGHIQATTTFKNKSTGIIIQKGEIGGAIDKTGILCPYGTSWVEKDALVLGSVWDDAYISGNSFIGIKTEVRNKTIIQESVCSESVLKGDLIITNSTITNLKSDGSVKIMFSKIDSGEIDNTEQEEPLEIMQLKTDNIFFNIVKDYVKLKSKYTSDYLHLFSKIKDSKIFMVFNIYGYENTNIKKIIKKINKTNKDDFCRAGHMFFDFFIGNQDKIICFMEKVIAASNRESNSVNRKIIILKFLDIISASIMGNQKAEQDIVHFINEYSIVNIKKKKIADLDTNRTNLCDLFP